MSQQEIKNLGGYFYRASIADFSKIPGNPIAYWVSPKITNIFSKGNPLSTYSDIGKGLDTGDNNRFLRMWYETSNSTQKWVPCQKGGPFRKWYGNNDFVINWANDGKELKEFSGSNLRNSHNYFRSGLSWTRISSSNTAFRFFPEGSIFESTGPCLFPEKLPFYSVAGFLNSKLTLTFLKFMAPTLDFQSGHISALPILNFDWNVLDLENNVKKCISIAKKDWDSYEGSWEFYSPFLSHLDCNKLLLKASYQDLRTEWQNITLEMQRLEEENNHIFIDAYDLQDELTPEVPLSEITLNCNPYYRYGGNLTDEEREQRLQSDTLAELISYIIGCMMGRYSLNSEGLVYANAGNKGFKTLVEEGVYARFPADSDGILPITTKAWFEDDIATRVEEFVRTVWGADHLEENLKFIATSLNLAAIKPVKKGGETSRETIRRYLSTQFFKDHLKTYKKRPIYWLFSSGKEKAFECLVYLHRYNETTLPRMRTEYVTPLLGQMDSRIERLRLLQNEAETAEAKLIGKEIDSLTRQLTELRSFDDQLKHYADMKIQLDLDDGVKINYAKFGTLLAEAKAITGDKAE